MQQPENRVQQWLEHHNATKHQERCGHQTNSKNVDGSLIHVWCGGARSHTPSSNSQKPRRCHGVSAISTLTMQDSVGKKLPRKRKEHHRNSIHAGEGKNILASIQSGMLTNQGASTKNTYTSSLTPWLRSTCSLLPNVKPPTWCKIEPHGTLWRSNRPEKVLARTEGSQNVHRTGNCSQFMYPRSPK